MNKHSRIFVVLIVLTIVMPACAGKPPAVRDVRRALPQTSGFRHLLGKSVDDEAVVEFIAINHCSRSGKFELCPATGLALWTNERNIVATVYLYVSPVDSFLPYRGVLPFGIKFYDSLGGVEHKLKTLEARYELDAVWNAGQPERGGSPDHMYYWATYDRYGMTIIYNAPFPDEDATIRAILINEFFLLACRRPSIAPHCGA